MLARVRARGIPWLSRDLLLTHRSRRRLLAVSLGLLAGVAAGALLMPGGGFDWYAGYARFSGDPFMAARPTWIYLLLRPIAGLAHSLVWFTLLNALAFTLALLLTDLPHPLLIIAMPVFWALYYGQIDGWVALGAVLCWRACRRGQPFWLGLGLLLLTSKPHIGVPLALLFAAWGRSWKMLVIPGAVLAVSMLAFGPWPLRFLETLGRTSWASYTGQTINISLWPWSLAALPLLAWRWRRMTRLGQAAAVLAATCLLAPYAPAYSLAALLFLTSAWPFLALLLLPAWGGWAWAQAAGTAFALAVLAWGLIAPQQAVPEADPTSTEPPAPPKPIQV